MDDREKLPMEKCKEITNDWIYDDSCTLVSIPVSELENFKGLFFVSQSVLLYKRNVEALQDIGSLF